MKKIVVIVLLFNTYFGFSQNKVFDYISLRDELKVINKNDQFEVVTQDIEGSPYLFEEFAPGKIIQEGKKDLNAYFRYNALQDVVEIKIKPNQNEIFILPRSDKFVFKLADYTFFLKNLITKEGEVLAGYKLKYYESDNLLFIGKSNSRITAAKIAETSYDRAKPPKIINNMNYYISFNGDPLVSVKIKEKDFRNLLGDSPKMKTYFKENKVKEIEDVLKMFEFYETNI
jgi:hypothetical protein